MLGDLPRLVLELTDGVSWGLLLGATRLTFGLAVVAWGAHRWTAHLARRWAGRHPVTASDRLTLTLLLALAFIASSTSLLALFGVLSTPILLGILVVWGLSALATRPGPSARFTGPAVPLGLVAVVAGVLVIDVVSWLPRVPSNWDAMGYHLFYPARWLQAGGYESVPTVFGDVAAEFSPHNGAMLFAWQMALLGLDTTTNVSQLVAVLLLGLGLYRLGRCLGASTTSATLVALWPALLAPVRRWTYSANVDVFMLGFALVGFAYLLAYRRSQSRFDLLVAALGGGLAAGTKMLGLPLAGSAGLVVAVGLVLHRRFGHLGLYLAATFLSGGWWFLHTAWRTGNPVFPLQVELGPWTLPGAYDRRGMMGSEFHIAGLGDLLAWTWGRLGTPALALAGVGVLALALGSVARRGTVGWRDRGAARWTLLYAVAWGLYFFTTIPHNNQSRFLLPALLLGLAGWAPIFGRLHRRRAGAHSQLAALVTLALLLDANPWTLWSTAHRDFPLTSPWVWWLLCGLLFALGGWSLRRLQKPGRPRPWAFGTTSTAVAIAALGVVILSFAGALAERGRGTVLAQADFRRWASGYAPFTNEELPPLRIAYTGLSVPQVLTGSGWRHHVRYVNTQGALDDGFVDFWRRNPKLYPHHKPATYRGADDFDAWLRNLQDAQIDLVAIFTVHPVERILIPTTADGFPIEQLWARQHSQYFQALAATPQAEIYRFVADPSAVSPSPDAGSASPNPIQPAPTLEDNEPRAGDPAGAGSVSARGD